jgi:hypothetical protein
MGDSYPEIKRVKDPPKEKTKPLHPNLPQPPALLLMISPIRTGKSTIISNLLLNEEFFGQDFFDQIIVISPTIHNDKTSRFLKKCADCYDEYSDALMEEIIGGQQSYDNLEDRPDLAIVLDDIIGVIRREAYINGLASRFRHYNIKMLLMSTQNFRKVSPVVRSNATHVIIGSPFPNNKELGKIAEEYGDQFGGYDNFLKIYHTATPNKYDFLYLDLTQNPPIARKCFSEIVAYGGQSMDKMDGVITNLNKTEEIKNNTSV